MRNRDKRALRLNSDVRKWQALQPANEENEITWSDFYSQIEETVTDESYQLDQLASANSGSDRIIGARG